MKRLDLNEYERSFFLFDACPGIHTVTFFDGAPPIDYLRQRTQEITKANPWVAAKRSKAGGVKHLVYPENVADLPDLFRVFDANKSNDAIDANNDFRFRDIDISKSYDEIYRAAVPLLVEKETNVTEEDDDYKGGFLVSLVVNTKNDNKNNHKPFALVVSLSHVIGDGQTFYALHHMLSAGATVKALDPVRPLDYEAKKKECMGEDQARGIDLPLTLRFVMGAIKIKLFPQKQVQQLYYVDDDYVADQKRLYGEQRLANDKGDGEDDEPTFVSTNDILTSWFYSHLRARSSIMVVNLRNRVEGITDRLAGNYQGDIVFRDDDSRTPAQIRRAVRSCGRLKVYPSWWSRMWSAPFAHATNWATVDGGIDLPGAEQRLHLPLHGVGGAADLNQCIIFRPKPGRLGLLLTSDRGISVDGDASGPIGEAIFD